jgi:hypothetical protein
VLICQRLDAFPPVRRRLRDLAPRHRALFPHPSDKTNCLTGTAGLKPACL